MDRIVRQTQGAVLEGRIARARGLHRTANPYGSVAWQRVADDELATANARIAKRLQEAWWIGWDEVDGELDPREPSTA